MNNRYIYSLIVLLFAGLTSAFAQTPVELHITHKLNGATFALGNSTQNNLGNDFNITRIEYYISKIQITHDGGMTTDVSNHYILADGRQDVTDALGSFNITNVEGISFYVGVDTPVNHADPSLQPSGHPLAPKSPSMHWGWSSGYRFVALEGKSGTGLNQNYEIHALGDQNYMKTSITTTGVMKNGKIVIALNADYANAVKDIDISMGIIAHGDGADEVKLLNNFNTSVFSTGFPVSVNNVATAPKEVNIYPNPSYNHNVSFAFGNMHSTADISITDIQGRTVQQLHVAASTDVVNVQLQNSGLYFVKVLYADGSTINRKVHIL